MLPRPLRKTTNHGPDPLASDCLNCTHRTRMKREPACFGSPETAVRGLLWVLLPSRNQAQPRVHPEDEACIQGPKVLEQNPREMEPCGGGGVEVQGLRWRRGWCAAWGKPWGSVKHRGSAKHREAAVFRWDQGLRGKGGGGQCQIVGLRAGGQRAREHH